MKPKPAEFNSLDVYLAKRNRHSKEFAKTVEIELEPSNFKRKLVPEEPAKRLKPIN